MQKNKSKPTVTPIIYGLHAVNSLMQQRPELIRAVEWDAESRHPSLQALVKQAQALGLNVIASGKSQLQVRLGEVNHQGVLAVCSRWPEADESLLDSLDASQQPLLLVLDGVQDPHNLGACLRTAEAAGVSAVIVPRDAAASLSPAVAKVAAGAVGVVPLVRVTNLVRSLRQLQAQGFWLVGTAMDAPGDLYHASLTGPLVIVLGAEGKGMRRLTREACDTLVYLPMHGEVESLNVSVTAGICLYEALRQRQIA